MDGRERQKIRGKEGESNRRWRDKGRRVTFMAYSSTIVCNAI